MLTKRRSRLGSVLSLLLIASLACSMPGLFGPTPTPLPPIAPTIVEHAPERGVELPPDGAITVYFDSPMDHASVESAFKLEPAVSGQFSWPDDSTLVFKPATLLERASRYLVSIGQTAKSQAGLALADLFSFKVDTVGFLEVAQVIPAPDTFEVEVGSAVTLMFNRPVVPLTSIGDQASLPNPLTLEPAVEGKGEWLNTSIYVFRPTKSLAGGKTYTGRVKAGLGDTTGGVLKEDFVWQFSTLAPAVVSADPYSDQPDIALTQPISITFNQPMEHASTQAAFALLAPSGQSVPGSFHWSEDDLSLIFVADQKLELQTNYLAKVDAAARSADGGAALTQPFTVNFTTVKAPAILSTDPATSEQPVDSYYGFRIYFASPMDLRTLESNIEILPEPTNIYTSWIDSEFSLYINWDSKPSTAYQVTLGAGMKDPYGNAIPEGRVVNFSTGPLPAQAYFNSNGEVGTYSAYKNTELYITTLNVDQAHFSLYRLPLQQFAKLTGPEAYDFFQSFNPGSLELLRAWTETIQNSLNEALLTRVVVASEGGPLDPGLYYLNMRVDGISADSHQLLVVSGANLTLKTAMKEGLVWATDLNSGQPISNLPIELYDQNFKQVAQGQTDAQGVFSPQFDQRPDLWTQMYAVSQGGPDKASFSIGLANWSDGIDPWNFGLTGEFYPRDATTYLYTDRPIYRPGQIVYFKGVLRNEDDARFSLPDLKEAGVSIYNDQGESVYSDKLKLTPFGTFSGEFKLAEEAGLGYYNLSVLKGENTIGNVSFSVAEYHKPEFQVNVESPLKQTVQGTTIPVTVDASFFFGGPVSNADVHWSVLSADYVFNYTGAGYAGYYDFYDFDYSSGESGPVYGTFGRLISEKEGKTDAQGQATLDVPADLSDSGLSQLYTIEATVKDINGQEVSGRTEVVVHQGQFYIGVRPEQYVGDAGKPVNFNFITVDWNSDPAPNQKLHIVYNEHQWNCALEKDPDTGTNSWTCHVKDTPVTEGDVTTDAQGLATASFTPPKGGVYQVKVSGVDSAGHKITASTIVWVSSGEYVSWRQNNDDRITLVADRKSYKPGDTAEILIPSPFQGSAVALVTIERGRLLKHEVISLNTNSTVYQLPLTADYAPDVFFSVVIVKGVDDNNPTPSFKMGTVKLVVSPEQQQLKVTLTPLAGKTKVGPRDTVTYAVKATDYAGKPVAAEFSIGVVDLAVLSLAPPNSAPILDTFYSERGLSIRTGVGLTLSIDRLNIQAARAKGGGGGGEAGFDEIRGNFLDTAYWKADVVTNENGEASVSVKLPDNLTTWRLDARGLTADTLVGQGTVDIVAGKDLLIRPVTPRFFVVGDQAQLGAVVNNNTAKDIDASVTLAGTGVTLDSSATQKITVKANDRAQVMWQVTVNDAASADLTFSVKGGGLEDASKPTLGLPPDQTLPIYKYSAPETTATAGQLTDANSVLEAINLPRSFDATQGELSVELDPSLAAGMTGGLSFLEHYPYECTEQTVSRFLPNVLTYQALKKLNLADPKLEANLTTQVNTGLQRLYARQHVDGGWGWWSDDESSAYVSAYVVFGLVKAKQAGFKVSDDVISKGTAYLQQEIVLPGDTADDSMLNRQAFILYTLAEAGQGQTSATVQLYDARTRLQAYARAYLALTLNLIDPADQRIKAMISDFNNAAILSATGAHWEESEDDWWNMNTDTRSTAIVLDALARLDPQNNLIPNVVRWLMTARKASAWETTQETAWALIGLTDWMVVSGELKANYDYSLTLNGKSLKTGQANADNLRDPISLQIAVADLLKDQANRLVVQRGTGDGRLYYTAHLNIYLPVEEVRSLNRGLTVARQYSIKNGDCGGEKQPACPTVTSANAGQDIQVKVTLIAPNDLYYVVLEDPIPAGTEPVDTSLLTTSVVGQPPELNSADPLYYGWGWWWFSNTDLRDEKVVLFATYLPKGTYEYTYTLHASLPGTYKVIPTTANEFYFPEVFGRGDGVIFTIK